MRLGWGRTVCAGSVLERDASVVTPAVQLGVGGLPDLAHAHSPSRGGRRNGRGGGPALTGMTAFGTKGSDGSLFYLFIPLLVLLVCVLGSFLLLALVLVLLTTFISHGMSPLLQCAHELDCPAADGFK
jgi:hypothetical protein